MELIEQIARTLCEQHIRTVRRHDTEPDKLEAMLPAAVDYSWRDFIPAAQAILPLIEAAVLAERERCAGKADDLAYCSTIAERIAAAIRSQP